MSSWLQSAGLQVQALSSASAACRLLSSEQPPGLVICEGSLEGQEHSEIQQVRAAAGGEVAILALLPSVHLADYACSYADGATAVMERPFSPHQLTEAARRMVGRRHLPREQQESDPLLGL